MTGESAPEEQCERRHLHNMGGAWEGSINHCSLHCRLAKFHGLMYMGKYDDVIGRETRFFVCAQFQFPGYGFLSTNHPRRIYPCTSNHAEFRQTTV